MTWPSTNPIFTVSPGLAWLGSLSVSSSLPPPSIFADLSKLPTQWSVEIYKFQTAENHSYRAFRTKIISACLSIKFAVREAAGLIDHYLSCFDIATIDWALIRRQLKIKSLQWSGNKTIFIGNKSLVVGKLVPPDIPALPPRLTELGIRAMVKILFYRFSSNKKRWEQPRSRH